MVTFWISPLISGYDSISWTRLLLSLYLSCAQLICTPPFLPHPQVTQLQAHGCSVEQYWVSHLPYGMVLLWASPVGCVVRKGFHPGTRPEVGLQFRPERHIYTLKASRLVIIEDAFDF